MEEWDALSGGTIVATVAATVTRALVNAPVPFANTALAVSVASCQWGFCVFLRNYQLVTYPTLLEDKDRLKNAVQNLLAVRFRIMARRINDTIDQMEHEFQDNFPVEAKQDLLRARAELEALQSEWLVDGDKGAVVDARDTVQSVIKREN